MSLICDADGTTSHMSSVIRNIGRFIAVAIIYKSKCYLAGNL